MPEMKLEEQIEIGTLPPAVWNILRDFESWSEWNPVCLESKWTGGTSWFEGATVRFRLKVGDEIAILDATLTEVDIPWLMVWTAQDGHADESHRFELEWEGRKSIVHYALTLESPSPIKGEGVGEGETVSDSNAAQRRPTPDQENALRAMMQAWLAALKTVVEERGNQFWELTYAGDAARGRGQREPNG